MTFEELKALKPGTVLTNKPALNKNLDEEIFDAKMIGFDVDRNAVVVTWHNDYTRIESYQAEYWMVKE